MVIARAACIPLLRASGSQDPCAGHSMPEQGTVLLPLLADQGCQVTALIGRDDADSPRLSRRYGPHSTEQDVAGRPRATADGERRRSARSLPGRRVRQPPGAGGVDAELDRKTQACWSTSVLPCPMCCSPAEPSDNLPPRDVTMHRYSYGGFGGGHKFAPASGHSDTPGEGGDDDAARRRAKTAANNALTPGEQALPEPGWDFHVPPAC